MNESLVQIKRRVGGYPTSLFKDVPNEDFTCGICLDILREPHQCLKGHCFCKSCLVEHLKSRRTKCPTCNVEFSNRSGLSFNLLIRNQINQLIIKCDDPRCRWSGPIEEYANHEKIWHRTHRVGIGETYRGGWRDGKYHGFGVKTFRNGDVYDGEYVDGVCHGECVYTFAEGSVFTGRYENNLRNGFGTFKYADKSTYSGHYKDHLKDGHGEMIYSNGDVYTGEWKSDQFSGQGSFTSGKGSVYCGQYLMGKRHGVGEYTHLETNEKYSGEWINGAKHGQGSMTYENGDYYCGHWVNDSHCGEGVMVYCNGDKYEGEFSSTGEYHGFGTFTPRSSTNTIYNATCGVYTGFWNDGVRSGKGDLRLFNGDIYQGDFLNNKFHGMGDFFKNTQMTTEPHSCPEVEKTTSTDHSSSSSSSCCWEYVYQGSWSENHRSGQGKMIISYQDEECSEYEYEGEWSNDVRCGIGTFIKHVLICDDNGGAREDKYVGMWRDDVKCGHGVYSHASGDTYTGMFRNNLRHGAGRTVYATTTTSNVISSQDDVVNTTVLVDLYGDIGVGDVKSTTIVVPVSHEGSYENDLPHGRGIMHYSDGSAYSGMFVRGMRTQGRIVSAEGVVMYKGGFKGGEKCK